jgi:hypothetical protein
MSGSLPVVLASNQSAIPISDGTSTISISTSTADATSITLNRLRTHAFLMGYNGTTWDQLRAGVTGVATSQTGFLNTLAGGTYTSTPLTLATGNSAPLQLDSAGNIQAATFQSIITVTPTVTATTYAANKCIGGLQTLTGALRAAKNTGILNKITLNFNTTAPTQGFTVGLFSANPSSSTFTDNTTAAINSADVGKLIGWYSVTSYTTAFGTHTSYVLPGIGDSVQGTSGNLYAAVICLGASVMAATSTFTNAIFAFLED